MPFNQIRMIREDVRISPAIRAKGKEGEEQGVNLEGEVAVRDPHHTNRFTKGLV